MMSEGVVLARLANSLKYKRCCLQNEVSLEDAEDIVITLTNNSNEIVDIREHDNEIKMKENLYPRLPMAPPIEDQGQEYRL